MDHKHFTVVTYGQYICETYFARVVSYNYKMYMKSTSKISFINALAHFARAVSYGGKVFMK